MTKKQFVTLYQERMELFSKKYAEELVNGFFLTLEEILEKDENLLIVGFGKFEVVTKAAKVCRNPKSKELMKVPERKVVKFKAGKNLAEKAAK